MDRSGAGHILLDWILVDSDQLNRTYVGNVARSEDFLDGCSHSSESFCEQGIFLGDLLLLDGGLQAESPCREMVRSSSNELSSSECKGCLVDNLDSARMQMHEMGSYSILQVGQCSDSNPCPVVLLNGLCPHGWPSL